jgi:hypothetical protein
VQEYSGMQRVCQLNQELPRVGLRDIMAMSAAFENEKHNPPPGQEPP